MTFIFLIRTVMEIVGILLLLYGFWHEDKLVEFEDRIKARIRERANSSRKK
nr:MAG TPA: hypothetical protein [Caudoviricetes sp.]